MSCGTDEETKAEYRAWDYIANKCVSRNWNSAYCFYILTLSRFISILKVANGTSYLYVRVTHIGDISHWKYSAQPTHVSHIQYPR